MRRAPSPAIWTEASASATRLVISAAGDAPFFEAEGDVLRDGHVRPESVALEHHAGIAPVRRHPRDVLFAEKDAPFLRLVKAGDGPQEGCFAAAAGAQKEEDFPALDAQIDAVEGDGLAKTLCHVIESDGNHGAQVHRWRWQLPSLFGSAPGRPMEAPLGGNYRNDPIDKDEPNRYISPSAHAFSPDSSFKQRMIRRDYLIVGAGVGGASACEGIREHDPKGTVMMVGNETCLPYHRSLLFQNCLNGRNPSPEKMIQHDAAWFEKKHIDLRLDTMVTALNVERHLAVLNNGQAVEFKKACLAMGARARRPQVAGFNLGNIVYLRTMRDMLALREMTENEREILIVGGGFLAAEAASLLAGRPKARLTILHRGKHLWDKKLDAETAEWFTNQFASHGIRLMLGEVVNGFEGRTILKNIQTKSGQRFPGGDGDRGDRLGAQSCARAKHPARLSTRDAGERSP